MASSAGGSPALAMPGRRQAAAVAAAINAAIRLMSLGCIIFADPLIEDASDCDVPPRNVFDRQHRKRPADQVRLTQANS
jgi:hypothetical protein